MGVVEDAFEVVNAAIRRLEEVTKEIEPSVVVAVAVYNPHSEEIKEMQYCSGFKDILLMQLETLRESIELEPTNECKCGRVVVKSSD